MKKKNNIFIDLTALLDVILIILFLVLVINNNKVNVETKRYEEEIKELKETQMPLNESEKRWYNIYKEKIGKIDLIYPQNYKENNIKVIVNDKSITKKQTDDFKKWLKDSINSIESEFIILSFTYNNKAIYYKDYTNTIKVINEIKREIDKKIIFEERVNNGQKKKK